MEKLGGERKAVQDTLIRYACEIGWSYIKPEEAQRLRGGNTGMILKEIFMSQMAKLNSEFIDNLMVEELIKRIERLPARIEGNMQAWEYLKGLRPIFVPTEKRERNVIFIDEEIKNNTFHITDEFTYTNGTKTNRYDVVFIINGVPVFFVETKSVAKFFGKSANRDSIISEALEQIRRYHKETPEMMTLLQLTTVTNIIHFLYAATWCTESKSIFNWKLENQAKTYEELVKGFFDKKRLVEIILKYILFTRKDDVLQKVVLRPHQMRAVQKITDRAEHKKKRRAVIWHTQGSGKTYTMIVVAERILKNPIFENPTVILLVDRNELETQMFNNLIATGYDQKDLEDRTAQTKKHLRELLQNDTRGLIISMIHKFENMPTDINTRKNVFVLVDEAHRTTGGDLGNYLMGALPNATYIGFTGTPIDKKGKGSGTFITFGRYDEPHGYLDKYGIAESINDGTTVKLHYTLAPNELLPDKEILEKEFLDLASLQGVSDIETLNKVLEKAVNLRNMLKNKQRIKKVADFVVDHYKKFVEPMGYKAFLVAVDREACALYKKELDKLLPKKCSEVVISPAHNDADLLSQFHLSADKEKQIRKAFTKPDKDPKILIVTEKLLTGFDAPILYCMYLDKPMRDHVLLQAIARVNRPYEDNEGRRKPSGFVLDFVGIFDKLEKALAFDHSDIEGVINDIDVLKRVLVPTPSGAHIPMAQLAEIKMVKGPAMIRNENGLLAGYVYVDMAGRDIGSYVKEAKKIVQAKVEVPAGYSLVWSGQYENMIRVKERLKVVVPVTLFIIFLLLYMNTKSMTKTCIVMLAVPFSLVGGIWLLYILGYHMSIAVWVGMIALMGLDAETGVFMLLYLDIAYEDHVKAGKMKTKEDLTEAIIQGAVKRIRPKMMTVMAAFMGLLPIMWSLGTGSDMMKRVAAPMVGGLFTSFILELLVYPVIFYMWKIKGLKKYAEHI